MWAKVLTAPATFGDLTIDAPDESALRPGEVLLRLTAAAICGSDLPHFRLGQAAPPVGSPGDPARPGVPLHEIVGEVVASRHSDHRVGQALVGWASDFNGLAEIVITDGSMMAPYDASLPPSIAVMIQPLACVIEAVGRLGDIRGCRAAVIGQGPIGLLFDHVLSTAGAAHVIGIDQVDRGRQAAAFRVAESVCARSGAWAESLAATDAPDVVVEAVGHQVQTLQDAIGAVAPYGQIFYFGAPDEGPPYPLDMSQLFRKNLTLRTGVTRHRREALAAADQYLASYPELAENYVTHVLPVSDTQAAFDLAAVPAVDRIKVALTYL